MKRVVSNHVPHGCLDHALPSAADKKGEVCVCVQHFCSWSPSNVLAVSDPSTRFRLLRSRRCLTPKDDLTPLTPVTPVSTTTTSWHRMEETPLLDPTTILPASPPATPASPQAFEVEMSRISLEVALGGAATDDDDWTRTSVFTAKSLFCRGCGQPKTTGMRFCTACGEENP